MRYYSIQIYYPTDGGANSGKLYKSYTSFVNNKTDPGAQQIELDIPVTSLAIPEGAASIKIWGVDLLTIAQGSDFNGKTIKVYAGFKPGLPLATLASNRLQAGLIVQGLIVQGFGNWVGTNQWLELIVTTNGNTAIGQDLNITLNWQKGVPLQNAVTQTLQTACPGYTVSGTISPNLVLAANETGYYHSLIQFAQHIKDISAALLNPPGSTSNYTGVDIVVSETGFLLSDGTSPKTPTKILFTDLIGQPTYINPGEIQVIVAMRADIQPTDYIILPTTLITIAPGDPLVPADRSQFQGTYLVKSARHVGNFREPDALAWVTVYNCAPAGIVNG